MTVEFADFAHWCSFCSSERASADVEANESLTLPVCDRCLDDFDNAVLPTLLSINNDG